MKRFKIAALLIITVLIFGCNETKVKATKSIEVDSITFSEDSSFLFWKDGDTIDIYTGVEVDSVDYSKGFGDGWGDTTHDKNKNK